MPLLMMAIFLAVQFSLVYLGNQVISSTARQAARSVRTGVNEQVAQASAQSYADKVGHGLVTNVQITFPSVPPGTSGPQIRVVVTGKALKLVPGIEAPTVSKTVQGPRETFQLDTP